MQIASLANVSVHFMRHAETLQQAGSFPWLVRVSGIVVFWISCVLGFSLRVSKKSSDLCSFPASCQSVFLQLRSKLLLEEVGSSLSTFQNLESGCGQTEIPSCIFVVLWMVRPQLCKNLEQVPQGGNEWSKMSWTRGAGLRNNSHLYRELRDPWRSVCDRGYRLPVVLQRLENWDECWKASS